MKFPTYRLLGQAPDADVNHAILTRDRAYLYRAANQAGPDIIPHLQRVPHQMANNVYGGCRRAATLRAALKKDSRMSTKSTILLNPHLPWDDKADQALASVSDQSLGRAIAQGGWKNPALYDDTRGHLTDRIRTLPSLPMYLYHGASRACWAQHDVADGALCTPISRLSSSAAMGDRSKAIEAARDAADAYSRQVTNPHNYHHVIDKTPEGLYSTMPTTRGQTIFHDDIAEQASQAAWDRLGANVGAWVLVAQMIDEWGGTFDELLDTAAALS